MDYNNMSIDDLALAIEELGQEEGQDGPYNVETYFALVAALRKAAKAEVVCGKDVVVGQVINGVMLAPNNMPDGYYRIIPKEA